MVHPAAMVPGKTAYVEISLKLSLWMSALRNDGFNAGCMSRISFRTTLRLRSPARLNTEEVPAGGRRRMGVNRKRFFLSLINGRYWYVHGCHLVYSFSTCISMEDSSIDLFSLS